MKNIFNKEFYKLNTGKDINIEKNKMKISELVEYAKTIISMSTEFIRTGISKETYISNLKIATKLMDEILKKERG